MLTRVSLRYLIRHPWQAGLCILGVALGVAMIVSIDLSNASARRAFTLSTEAIAGRATHQIIGGPTGLDEDLYRRIRADMGIRLSAPIVEGYVQAPTIDGGITLHLLGVDPFAEPPFRSYLAPPGSDQSVDVTALLAEPSTVLIAEQFAHRYDIALGSTLDVRIGSRTETLRVVGVLNPLDTMSQQVLETMLIADIATAQELLGMVGHLSRIDLILSESDTPAVSSDVTSRTSRSISATELQALLPRGVELTRPAARTSTLQQMTRAFELNLSALSLLALIVGMFLIYNTITFSVVQRRELLGTLRCIGVTRRQIFALVMIEALVISLVGSLVGVLLGIVLGRGLVRLVTQTITDMYFVMTIRSLIIDPMVLMKGMLIGIGTTLLAAIVPAREATMVAPRLAMQRSNIEEQLRRSLPRASYLGIGLILIAVVLLNIDDVPRWNSETVETITQSTIRNVHLPFAALLVLLIGCALLTPLMTTVLMAVIRPVWGVLFGMSGRMAARGVVATLSRTSVAIAALMVAVSVTIGVGTMVGSFRQTVIHWLDQSLSADIYISPPGTMANRVDTTLDRALLERLVQTPGIAGQTIIRGVQVRAPTGPTTLMAIDRDKQFGMRALRFKDNRDMSMLEDAFDRGEVFISEPLAYRTGLGPGDMLRLQTDRGEHDFRIAAIYYDYTSERGVIQMAYPTYRTFWDDPNVTSSALYVKPGADVEKIVRDLRQRVGAEHEVLIRSHRTLRQNSLEIFDRTFAITGVLQILATIVAFIGILSALMALQLERTREIGLLRANGLTPQQVWGVFLSQTGLMGLTAGVLSLPVGLMLALVLIYIINRRSFGWTLDLMITPGLFVQAVVLAVVAALLAGVYPAWRMGRTSPSVALREE